MLKPINLGFKIHGSLKQISKFCKNCTQWNKGVEWNMTVDCHMLVLALVIMAQCLLQVLQNIMSCEKSPPPPFTLRRHGSASPQRALYFQLSPFWFISFDVFTLRFFGPKRLVFIFDHKFKHSSIYHCFLLQSAYLKLFDFLIVHY